MAWSGYVQAVDAWWGWDSWDARRLWTPRFLGTAQFSHAYPRPPPALLVRMLLAAYILAADIFERSYTGSPTAQYFSYLTNQGRTLVTAYFVLATAIGWVVALDAAAPVKGRYVPSWAASRPRALLLWTGVTRATQLLWTLAVTYEPVIVVLYWLLLRQQFVDPVDTYRNAQAHAVVAVLLYADFLLLSSLRLIDRQALFVLAASTVYLLWNIIYTFTVRFVYPVLKWDGAGSAILAIGALLFLQLVFFAVTGPLGLARDAVAARYNGTVHIGVGCCCCRCSGVVAAITAPPPSDSPSLYPRTFLDDTIAFPGSSCVDCCKAGAAGEPAATRGDSAEAPTLIDAGSSKDGPGTVAAAGDAAQASA